MKKKISSLLAVLLILSMMIPMMASAENVSLAYRSGALNLRKGPGVGYSSMGTVHHGDHIDVVQRGDVWTKVKTDGGKVGYIKNLYILDGNPNYASGTKYLSSRYTAYTTASVHFRAGASSGTASMGTMPEGTRVTVLGTNNGFYLVKDENGHQGFLSQKYVSTKKPAKPSKPSKPSQNAEYQTVTGNFVNLRKEGTIKSDVLMVVTKGTKVEVLYRGNYWNRVICNGTVGWIRNTYLK